MPDEGRTGLVDLLREHGYIRSTQVARIQAVPRESFVTEANRATAYEDIPLDIGESQVISTPHTVARLTELLEPKPGQKVLEIGTGNVYHAAVMAEIVGAENLYSLERHPVPAAAAKRNLENSGYGAITVVVGDGSNGLPEHALYERIHLTCAAPDVPSPLTNQLADDGRMVLPIGRTSQALVVVEKHDSRLDRLTYDPVCFVPLIGEHGFDEGE